MSNHFLKAAEALIAGGIRTELPKFEPNHVVKAKELSLAIDVKTKYLSRTNPDEICMLRLQTIGQMVAKAAVQVQEATDDGPWCLSQFQFTSYKWTHPVTAIRVYGEASVSDAGYVLNFYARAHHPVKKFKLAFGVASINRLQNGPLAPIQSSQPSTSNASAAPSKSKTIAQPGPSNKPSTSQALSGKNDQKSSSTAIQPASSTAPKAPTTSNGPIAPTPIRKIRASDLPMYRPSCTYPQDGWTRFMLLNVPYVTQDYCHELKTKLGRIETEKYWENFNWRVSAEEMPIKSGTKRFVHYFAVKDCDAPKITALIKQEEWPSRFNLSSLTTGQMFFWTPMSRTQIVKAILLAEKYPTSRLPQSATLPERLQDVNYVMEAAERSSGGGNSPYHVVCLAVNAAGIQSMAEIGNWARRR